METTAIKASSSSGGESSTSMVGEVDSCDMSIFTGSAEYKSITESLATLKVQLEQAYRDIQTLQDLKKQATSEPDRFIKQLEDEEALTPFPPLQRIKLVPNINLTGHKMRLPRRALSKYDQNLEYFINKIQAVQNKRPIVDEKTKEILSCLLPIPPLALTFQKSIIEEVSKEVLNVRHKFREITGTLRSASAPAIILPTIKEDIVIDKGDIGNGILSPQPVKAQSVQFTVPLLPNSRGASPVTGNNRSKNGNMTTTSSTSTTPTAATSPLQTQVATNASILSSAKRKKSSYISDSPHHNLPWTEEERRRLMELLEIYPDEPIHARRYAKIAAALGTRTSGQVANRINKLMIKQRKRQKSQGNILEGGDFDESLLVKNQRVKESEDYKEYELLKKQIGMIQSNPSITIHHSFRCDGCGMDPIIGIRWSCTKCHGTNAVDLCQDCHKGNHYDTRMSLKLASTTNGSIQKTTHRSDHIFIKHS